MDKPFTKPGGVNLYGCQICTDISVFIVSIVSGNGKIIRDTNIMFLGILMNGKYIDERLTIEKQQALLTTTKKDSML